MTRVEVGNFKIACHVLGRGEPVLLVHGITTYSFLWKDVVPALTDNFKVITVDLLGCGESDKPHGGDYSISAQAEIIVKLLDRLGLERTHLVGHDVGGGIGQIIAVRYPERVRTLTLINTVAYDYWPVQPIITLRVPLLRHIAVAAFNLGVLRAIILRGFVHREKVTKELMSLFSRPLQTPEGKEGLLQLAKCLDHRHLMEIAGQLRDLPMPTLIIWGERDIYLKSAIAERLHREIKNSKLVYLPTAGHFVPLDEPARTAELIRETAAHSVYG